MIPLKQIHIPTPCHESWEAMDGDAQARFCAGCRKHVHNLSEMTRDEAQGVLDRAEGHVCVRFFPDADGRPLTREDWAPPTPIADVPVFATRGWRRLAVALSGAVAVLMAGLGSAQAAIAPKTAQPAKPAQSGHAPTKPQPRYRLGQFTLPKPPAGAPKSPVLHGSAHPGFDSGPAMMGGPRVAPPVSPPQPAMMGGIAPPRAMMGDIATPPPPLMGEPGPVPKPQK